jgi:hypothetical protein
MYRIIDALINQWVYDIEVLSTPWVLWTIFPALFYALFMLVKWFFLTCPIWVPAAAIVQTFTNAKK